MKKIVLTICLILLWDSAVFNLEASFYRDKIFVGKKREVYKYFFTATEYTKEADMMHKINKKVFPLRKKINMLIIAEIPSSLSSEDQESMWSTLNDVSSAMKALNYNADIKFNGYLDKTISTYKIHVYYR